jgi:hypothetical protein
MTMTEKPMGTELETVRVGKLGEVVRVQGRTREIWRCRVAGLGSRLRGTYRTEEQATRALQFLAAAAVGFRG